VSEPRNQTEAVLWHLEKFGSITSWEAIKEYGATRLSAIIFSLRDKGHQITSKPERRKTRFGKGVTISRYELEKSQGQLAFF